MDTFILVLELIGTIAFAVTGVIKAIEKDLDIFGTTVLGFTTAVGGGIVRDILIGCIPPRCFINPIYAIVAFVASLVCFLGVYFNKDRVFRKSRIFAKSINIFDAIGLGIFVVVGIDTSIAIIGFSNAFLSIFVGVITGIGGGMIRDIMAAQIPSVLKKKVYAIAAILGGLVYYLMLTIKIDEGISAFISIALVVIMRLMATHYNWKLPRI